MSWVDEAIAEATEFQRREQLRQTKATPMYRELRNEIRSRVKELKESGAKLSPYFQTLDVHEGDPYDLVISMSQQVPAGQNYSNPKELHVAFNQKASSIHTSGPGPSLTFAFVVEGEQVHLSHERQQVSIEDAGRLILKPFFFPELQKSLRA
jgi:hypothetical protein